MNNGLIRHYIILTVFMKFNVEAYNIAGVYYLTDMAAVLQNACRI